MNENIKHNLHLPIYNIKAVSRLVGLLPVTLRAWERRYGMPSPNRGQQGYRLYSDYDIRTLRWLKSQINTGLSIGRAVEYLNELRANGFDPTVETVYQDRSTGLASSSSLATLANQLMDALIHFDEPIALEIIHKAFAFYPVHEVLLEVIQPTLIGIGDAWHRGELAIAVEHYATQFCMQQLMSMLAAASPPKRQGAIIAACAPGERHQIGLLMLVTILRWRGWNVKYLGPDLPLTHLEEAISPVHPQVLMFSANMIQTAEHLTGLSEVLARFAPPHPLVVVGGQAFQHMRLPESVPAIYLNVPAMEAIQHIEEYMLHSQANDAQETSEGNIDRT